MAGILVVGLALAIFIYVGAGPADDSSAERLEDSKRYLRQMELYGGTANVLASQIREWFDGLWHGRRLAFTVAGLSAGLAGAAYLALTPRPAASGGDYSGPGSGRAR